MKFSRFNIIIKRNEYWILYNTLTGNVVKIPPSSYSTANKDLLRLGYLVENDGDDLLQYKYMYYGQMFNCKSINLVIATSMDCNLNCPYCFEGSNKRPINIDINTKNSILSYLLKHQSLPISITWFGGEPMLAHQAIGEISNALNAESVSYTSHIITNGTIFPDLFLSKIDCYNIKSVQITLDGVKATHDSKRHFKNGKGTFDIIIANAQKVLERSNAEVVLKMNIDASNIDEYAVLARLLKTEFADYIANNRVTIPSNYIRKKRNFDGIEKCIGCREYFDFELKNGKATSMPALIGPCPLRCRGYFVIGPDGTLYKCMEHLGEAQHVIGNINSMSFSIRKESSSCMRYMPFDDRVCSHCNILPICGGGCPNERAKSKGEERPCPAEKYKINDIITKLYDNQ